MFTFSEEDAVLIHETRHDGYVPTSRECWPLPAFDETMTPNQRRDFALACALASNGALWNGTNWFDRMVLSTPESLLSDDEVYRLLNERAG